MTIERNTGFIAIEEDESLLRDRHSKGLISTDREAFEAYRKQRELRRKSESLETRVEAIETKLDKMMDKLDRLLND